MPWSELIKDFKRRHPRLAKQVTYWRPLDYMRILIYLDDGMMLEYDYLFNRAYIREERWKEDK